MSDQNEIYSKVVRAGKRTYFFDIKSTKGNDLYITLTVYKEDFEKFKEGLDDVLAKIEELRPK
ncbi:MAG: DUF3276 family protein [Flavobacteriia bacterium]|nr:DUF3276 family protein [Flavobacteriia bacterium]